MYVTNQFIVCVGGPQRPTSFTNGRGRATTTATLQYCTAPPGGGTAFDCTFLVGHSPRPPLVLSEMLWTRLEGKSR